MPTVPRRRLPALLVVVALVAAACVGGGDPGPTGTSTPTPGASPTPTPPAEGFSIYTCPPQTLLPTDNQGNCGATVIEALFTGLVEYDPATSRPRWGDECRRCMAASIESDDARTWTITLKDGWRFHDGREITAQTLVDSWNFAAYGPNQQANSFLFGNVEGFGAVNPGGGGGSPDAGATPSRRRLSGLEIVDERTFRVRLRQPFSHYPVTLGHRGFYPLPAGAREQPEQFLERPVGNGPFRVAGEPAAATPAPTTPAEEAVERIELERWVAYPGEPAAAEAATFRVEDSLADAYEALEDGDLDVMAGLPADQLEAARETFGDRFVSRTGGFYHTLVLPSGNEQLADDDVARALSMAIDRGEIAREVLGGTVTAADGLAPPVVLGARPDPCGEACDHHPRRAARMLRRAGGLDGPLTIWFNSGAGLDAWIGAIADQWEEHLGIQEVELRPRPFDRYLQQLGSGRVQGPYRLGWAMDYPSLAYFLEPLHVRGGRVNFDRYRNRRAERLIARANAAGSIQAAIEPFQQAADLILDDWHHIPLWFSVDHLAHTDRVGEVGFDPFGHVRVADVVVGE